MLSLYAVKLGEMFFIVSASEKNLSWIFIECLVKMMFTSTQCLGDHY